MIKWLHSQTREDRICHLRHFKQGFDNWIWKNPCTQVEILQCRWVDTRWVGKRLLLVDGAQKESVNGFYCIYQWVRALQEAVMGPVLFNTFINDLERAVEHKITRCAGDTKWGKQLWIHIAKSRAGIERDLAWRNGLAGTLWNSTRTNAKCCNPESKQYRLQWLRQATDWLAAKKQVCQKGHGGQQTEQEPLVCTGEDSQ